MFQKLRVAAATLISFLFALLSQSSIESVFATGDKGEILCREVVAIIGGKPSIGLVGRWLSRVQPGKALADIFPLPVDQLEDLRSSLQDLLALSLSDTARRQALTLLKESMVRLPAGTDSSSARDLISLTVIALATKATEGDRAVLKTEAEMGLLGSISQEVQSRFEQLPMPIHREIAPQSDQRGLVVVRLGSSQTPAIWDPRTSSQELADSKEGSAEWARKSQTGLLIATEVFRKIVAAYKTSIGLVSDQAVTVRVGNFSEHSYDAQKAMGIVIDVASKMGGGERAFRVRQLHHMEAHYSSMMMGRKAFDPEKVKLEVKKQWKWLQERGLQMSSASMLQVSGYQTQFNGGNAYEVINLERKAALISLIELLLLPESYRRDLAHNYWESASLALRSLVEPQDTDMIVPLLLLHNSLNVAQVGSAYDITNSTPLILQNFFGIKVRAIVDPSTKAQMLEPEDDEIRAALSESMNRALDPYRAIREYRQQEIDKRAGSKL